MFVLKAKLNLEMQMLLKFLGKVDEFHSMIIQCPKPEEVSVNEFSGITDTIIKQFKKEIKRSHEKNKDGQDKLKSEIDAV